MSTAPDRITPEVAAARVKKAASRAHRAANRARMLAEHGHGAEAASMRAEAGGYAAEAAFYRHRAAGETLPRAAMHALEHHAAERVLVYGTADLPTV